jgi:hypothetical protein
MHTISLLRDNVATYPSKLRWSDLSDHADQAEANMNAGSRFLLRTIRGYLTNQIWHGLTIQRCAIDLRKKKRVVSAAQHDDRGSDDMIKCPSARMLKS